jgi:hypothetical protein
MDVADTKGFGVSVAVAALAAVVGLLGAAGVAVACWLAIGVAVEELSQAASATLTATASMSSQTYRMLTDLLLLPSSAPLFLIPVTVPDIKFPPGGLLDRTYITINGGIWEEVAENKRMPA